VSRSDEAGDVEERSCEAGGGGEGPSERTPADRTTANPGRNGHGERYDLQVHTDASPCSGASPTAVVDAAASIGLDGVAITDHDTLAGVDAARAAAPDGFTVVPGLEVTTTAGHVLALDVEMPPEPGDPLSVVEAIHDQDGVAVLAHPFDRLREHFAGDLAALAGVVDAVEAVNSRCLRRAYVRRARSFAAANDLPATGGSDAHFPMEVGRAYTVCAGDPAEAIRRGATRPGGRAQYLSGHAATKLHEVSARLRP
jgi:predicted metal-dependent phosphoesterase TrpH